MTTQTTHWMMCDQCQGQGTKYHKLNKKTKLNYQLALDAYEQAGSDGSPPVKPTGHLSMCPACHGRGILASPTPPIADTDNYPHVAIIGAGIGGVALAVACLHRGIPFTLFERDVGFNTRKQGYGLTLQQAHKAIAALGITELPDGVVSTRHVVHTPDGTQVAQWGTRHWNHVESNKTTRRTNIHIPRQSLRMHMLDQLNGHTTVMWGHQLIKCLPSQVDPLNMSPTLEPTLELSFEVDGQIKHAKANLVVGADGIRSTVRTLLIDEYATPLRYLGCIVILGICPLAALEIDHELLDSATVFQTANGHERMYMMPYNNDTIMWQLSFPMTEADANLLSEKGSHALKEEACRRTPWHDPIPQILAATRAEDVTGYPVYDRDLLTPDLLQHCGAMTLLGDAAHPMSPFKGQGANQAILDALSLARGLTKNWPVSEWKKTGLRSHVLNSFEAEMLERSKVKVKASQEAAAFLHSDVALLKVDQPRRPV